MRELHAQTKTISRQSGRSAVAAAAYRSGSKLTDERQGLISDYSRRAGIMHTEIIVPEGAPAWTRDRSQLWNMAEATNRKNATTAREWIIGLPHELTHEERVELTREIAGKLVDRYGVIVDIAIHAPDKKGDQRNFHAHLLMTTRKVTGDGLGERSDLELSGTEAKRQNKATAPEQIKEIREIIAEAQNRYLRTIGHETHVEHRSFAERGIDLEASRHIGVVGQAIERRGAASDRSEQEQQRRERNAKRIEADPDLLLDRLTEKRATFTRRDMARALSQYIDNPGRFNAALARLEQAPQVKQLLTETRDENGRILIEARYTTVAMAEIEADLVTRARDMAENGRHKVNDVQVILAGHSHLSDEQRTAIEHVTGSGDCKVLIGAAGTGKSTAMASAREVWEAQGYRVRGAALSGIAAEGLETGSGIESRTLASWEKAWKAEKEEQRLGKRNILVIDEAGMVGSRQLARVMAQAQAAGAKVVLVGDAEQLQSIEAGAGFRTITERIGAAEMTIIRRQHEEWAKVASRDFARGDIKQGLEAYASRGYIQAEKTSEEAKDHLIRDWAQARQRQSDTSSLILAYRRADVRDLNERARTAMRERGELGQDHEIAVVIGQGEEARIEQRNFAAGGRIMFLKNDVELKVKNGLIGTIEEINAKRMTVRLEDGSRRRIDLTHYAHLDHGYACSIHKSQGTTRDKAFIYLDQGVDRHLAYVAMTRHRDQATAYYAQEVFSNIAELIRSTSRARSQDSTLDYEEGRMSPDAQQRKNSKTPQSGNAEIGLSRAERSKRAIAERQFQEKEQQTRDPMSRRRGRERDGHER